jgi:site-specific DNA-methyltransferase (adenine-specific)
MERKKGLRLKDQIAMLIIKSIVKKDWDKEPPSIEYFNELQRVSKNQIIWGANHFIERIPNANSSCWIVWDKKEEILQIVNLAWCSFKKL